MKAKPTTPKIEYMEHLITKKCGFYWALGRPFKTLKQAKKAIIEFELLPTL